MKKVLMVIGGIVLAFILFGILIFLIVSFTSKKLICKSKEGNITIMYNDKTITGYKAFNLTYDMDEQKDYAEKIGINAYIDEFENWFAKSTTGTCKK